MPRRSSSIVPDTTEIVAAAQLHPRADEDPQPADRRRSTRPPSTRRPSSSRSSSRQQVSATWRAPHFVWQVREELAEILCPDTPDDCERGRHRRLPRHHDARLEHAEDRREVGLRRGPRPERRRTRAPSSSRARSRAASGAGSSACAATTSTTPRPASSTTGPARSSPTSAARATRPRATRSSSPSSTSWPTAGASPDRRSSRSTTLIGIEDETMTAATMFMDVVDELRRRLHRRPRPTSSSAGPVRLRCALQFSLNIPAIKAGDHQRPRPPLRADQGLRARPTRHRDPGRPRWASARSRSTRSTCSAPTATIANGGVHMPRQMIIEVVDEDGRDRLAARATTSPRASEVVEPAGRLHHHRHPGRQHRS